METDILDALFKSYFEKPYRPEYFVKKVKDLLENSYYEFKLIKELNGNVIQSNFQSIFIPIFGEKDREYKFNEKVEKGKSIGNFKNMVYEKCKLNAKEINIKEIIYYLFVLPEFKERIINSIYQLTFDKINVDDIYNEMYKKFIYLYFNNKNYNKNEFDAKYFNNWMNDLKKEDNEVEISNGLFDNEKIKENYLKYEYYGPDELKYNYTLNGFDKDEKKVVLFSPDFLLANNLIDSYESSNFQIYNENNTCLQLYSYILDEGINQKNKEIKKDFIEDDINDNIASNSGFITFEDKTVGFYIDCIEMTHYYEIEHLFKNLKRKDNLHVVILSSKSTQTQSKMEKEKEEYDLTDEQKFYSEYNSHVTEEQLSYAIIETICHEMSNSSIERLPRIIFYFNLYIFKSSIEKERIAFTAKEKEYGFEEADGVFYLGSDDLILNQNGNIPFLKNKKYVLNINDNAVEIDEDKIIKIESNSLIYMEVKTSFPLKYGKNEKNEEIIVGKEDTKSYIRSFIRKSQKFYQIAKKQKKEIKRIHILFLYDYLLPKDIKKLIYEFTNIFLALKTNVKLKTIFEVIYFVNPASLNLKKLSSTIRKLEKENNESKKKIDESKKIIDESKKTIDESKKTNDELKKKIDESNKIIDESKKTIDESKKTNDELKKKIDDLKKQIEDNDKNMKASISKITDLTETIDELKKSMEAMKFGFIFPKINEDLIKNKENVFSIQCSKHGVIFLSTQSRLYIVQNNSILTFPEYRSLFLLAKNGDLFVSKSLNIFKYSNNDFSNSTKININKYQNQFIELMEDNKILVVTSESELIIIKKEGIDERIQKYKDNNENIISLIEANKNEIVILLNNKNNKNLKFLAFFDLAKREEIKRIEFQNTATIHTTDIFCINNNDLYICLGELFKIDITKKSQIIKTNLKLSKIYKFGNKIFGIRGNSIYNIFEEKNDTREILKYNEKDFSTIYCLYLTKENHMIVSVDNNIKYYDFN